MAQSTPLQFDIPDMRCHQDVDKIIKALKQLNPKVDVLADLETKRLMIGAEVDAGKAAEAIESIGFTVKAAK